MSYTINKYNATELTVLIDGVLDNETTSLNLIGKNVENFGESQNENFVYLLENFANSVPPSNPIEGQVWFDSTKKQLFVFNGTAFELVGPEKANLSSTTRMRSTNVKNSSNQDVPIIAVIINDEVIAIISSSSFTISEVDPLAAGFTAINRGFNYKNYYTDSNNVKLYGKATIAEQAVVAATVAITDKSTNIATTQFVHNILPTGIILMWGGSINAIPAGWALCDGSGGTPNLTSKFILGASNSVSVGSSGGSTTSVGTINSSGIHGHGSLTGNTTLTVDQLPSHNHASPAPRDCVSEEVGYPFGTTQVGDARVSTFCDSNGNTDILGLTSAVGSGQAHNHSIAADGSHIHTMNSLNIMPPWYALCYIIKTT